MRYLMCLALFFATGCPKAEPVAPLPKAARPSAPFVIDAYPAEVKRVVEDVRAWPHYQARIELVAFGKHVMSTSTVSGVPARAQMRLETGMGGGRVPVSKTVAIFDGARGVAKSEVSGEVPEEMNAALKLGMAAGLANKHFVVDQAALGTPASPFVGGLHLGTSGVGQGEDLQGTLLAMLEAKAWREVVADQQPGRMFEAVHDASSWLASAVRHASPALLELEDDARRASIVSEARASRVRIAIDESGKLVAVFLNDGKMTIRILELDTSTPPPPNSFDVGSLDPDDATDISKEVRRSMEPLALLLADDARLQKIEAAVTALWGPAENADDDPAIVAAREAKVSGVSVDVELQVLGSIPKAKIEAILERPTHPLVSCALKTAKSTRMELRFTINSRGAVPQVDVKKVAPKDRVLEECVVEAIRGTPFPGAQGVLIADTVLTLSRTPSR